MYRLTERTLKEDMKTSGRDMLEELYAKNIELIIDALRLCQDIRSSRLKEAFRQPPDGSFQSLYEQAVEYGKNISYFEKNFDALQTSLAITDLSGMRGDVIYDLRALVKAVFEFRASDPEEARNILNLVNKELEIMEALRRLANRAIEKENRRRALFAQRGGSPNRPLPLIEQITLVDIGLPPHQE